MLRARAPDWPVFPIPNDAKNRPPVKGPLISTCIVCKRTRNSLTTMHAHELAAIHKELINMLHYLSHPTTFTI
jgi:hypothetical protein